MREKINPNLILGQRFEKLIVESFSHRDSSGILWMNFRCDCGHLNKYRYYYVRKGRVFQCHKCRPHHFRLAVGEATLNQLLTDYKARSKKKGFEFSLSKEEFKKIVQRNCHYCQSEPVYKVRDKHNFGGARYHGIDRVNPKKGYTSENSVPCCKICNTMKMTLSFEEFKQHIERIHMHLTQG